MPALPNPLAAAAAGLTLLIAACTTYAPDASLPASPERVHYDQLVREVRDGDFTRVVPMRYAYLDLPDLAARRDIVFDGYGDLYWPTRVNRFLDLGYGELLVQVSAQDLAADYGARIAQSFHRRVRDLIVADILSTGSGTRDDPWLVLDEIEFGAMLMLHLGVPATHTGPADLHTLPTSLDAIEDIDFSASGRLVRGVPLSEAAPAKALEGPVYYARALAPLPNRVAERMRAAVSASVAAAGAPQPADQGAPQGAGMSSDRRDG